MWYTYFGLFLLNAGLLGFQRERVINMMGYLVSSYIFVFVPVMSLFLMSA